MTSSGRETRREVGRLSGRGVLAGIAFALQIAAAGIATAPAFAAPAISIGGPFSLRTSDGLVVTDQTYKGRWLLVYFGYTSCPDACPTALFEIAVALKQLGAEAAALQPLFIAIDPDRDTPGVVGPYARSFDPRIVGLSGSRADVEAAMKAYRVYANRRAEEDAGGQFDHSGYIYLMNPRGAFVRAFDHDWSGDRIAAKVREAMASADR